ncbi:MAG: PAS domain S-box protein, partial [Bacteroidia bacterium]
MKTDKPTYEELQKRVQELELLVGINRALKPIETAIFENPEFSKFINLSRDGKIIANRNGIIIGWNKAMEGISGIEQSNAIGRYIWDIKYDLTPDNQKAENIIESIKFGFLSAFKNPEKFPDQIHEFSLKTKSGEIRILEDHSTFIVSPDEIYFLSILRDITAKKKSDLALIESEKRHRGLLNSLELGIIVYDKTGEILLANPKSCSLFDITKKEESEHYNFNYKIEYLTEHHEIINDDNCPVQKVIRTKQSIRNFLMGARLNKQKEIIWLMVNAYPEFNEYMEVEEVVVSLLDITDRRKIVQALHIKNVALDSSLLPIGITDLDGKLNYVNPALIKQWGYESEFEMIGTSALDFWMDTSLVKITIDEVKKSGSSSGEFIGKRKDGSTFPVAYKISTIIDDNNVLQGLVGSFEDLTEIKNAQLSIKESEEKFKSIANYSASWEGWFDVSGKLVWMNSFSEQLTGFTPEDYLEAEDFFAMSVYKDDIEKGKAALLSALSGSSGNNLEVRCNKKSGGYIWISISWRPIYDNDGNSIGIRTSSKDITDRIQTNHDLEKSKKQYDNLVANIDVGVFIIHSKEDNSFYFDYVSPKLAEIIHEDVQLILENPMIAFKSIHPDEIETFLELNREMQANKSMFDWKGRLLLDGEIRWIHIVSKPEIQLDGDVLWHGLLIDITNDRKIQEEIASKNTQLLKVISEKDKFFSIIAHDLRNPFSAFMGLTKIMVEDISDLSREEIHEFAEAMSISANNLYNLLENLLEWSRLQRGVTAFNPKPIFIKTQIEETVKTLMDQAAKKKINVSILVPQNLTVHADINMFSAIVRNLLSNAIKFTNAEGIIKINATESNHHITVSISDNGIGMKQDLINKLFKIDEHSNRPGTDGEPSTGLGLILCKDFIEKHKGTIWAESTENVGSTF